MPNVVSRARELHEAGAVLYLWSSGGAEYAEKSAAELGISNCFAAFLPKPDAYLDDQAVSDWRFCKHVLPSNAEHI
jgi:hypothetical protein